MAKLEGTIQNHGLNMRHSQLLKLAMVGAFIIGGSIATPNAQAHHRDGHGGGPPASSANATENTTDGLTEDIDHTISLTTAQRTFLVSVLNGTSDQDYLLTDTIRADIQSQIDTLPPGIQRRLARGRELPPGIAKKVTLPTQVNQEMGIDEALEITILGEHIAIIDPLTNQIIDLLRNIL